MRYNKATMTIFLSVLAIGLYGMLLVAMAMRPHDSQLTRYELERRAQQGDMTAQRLLQRTLLAGPVDGLLVLLRLAFYAITIGLFSAALGVWVAVLLGGMLLLLAPVLMRLPIIKKLAQQLYDRYEPQLMQFLDARPRLSAWIRADRSTHAVHVGSREELAHIIDQSGAHLSHDQQKLLLHSLKFDDRTVGDVMTRKGEIDTIDRRELLGPLVLDDLHKTGHSVFPVTDGGIDHVVGVLSITGFLSLDSKRSVTAEKAMTPHVERISETASLRVAMQQFVRSHQHLLIVVNDEQETVGVLSLHDVMTALFGR